MTDRELLELAAKASGIEGAWGNERYIERHEGFIPNGWLRAWNPLNDDGDALRLAVTLHIDLDWTHCLGGPHDTVQAYVQDGTGSSTVHEEAIGSDPYAATRRAIVRAAAEIGKGKA